MKYPNFYDQVESIKLYDPLSDFLGALDKGDIEITYIDCVKLAGHSCPTVAGAYLIALVGLKALYGHSLPERGGIHVSMRGDKNEGVTGVVCNVLSFIVGANDSSGFKGIKGSFSRDNLVAYSMPMEGEVTLTRLDTNKSISISYNPSIIPADEKIMPLMGKNLKNITSNEEKILFKTLWQERVKKILLSKELLNKMITLH